MFIFSHLLIREYLCKIFAKIHVDKLGMCGIILFTVCAVTTPAALSHFWLANFQKAAPIRVRLLMA